MADEQDKTIYKVLACSTCDEFCATGGSAWTHVEAEAQMTAHHRPKIVRGRSGAPHESLTRGIS